MGEKNDLYAHATFGDTNRANGVPDCPDPEEGPVYLEGRLVLSLSFQGKGKDAVPQARDSNDILERYRLWDDLSETWYDSNLEVQRFERVDAVVRIRPRSIMLWTGAMDTRARVIPEPDLDAVGMVANQKYDLRWKRV